MPTIDHAVEADDAASEGKYDIAQYHATRLLAEQQRIANLIALGQFRVAPGDVAHFRHLVAQPLDEYSITVSPQIKEALGLS